MTITKLGENLFQVKVSWKTLDSEKAFVEAILQIQARGRVVTQIYCMKRYPDSYLICTMEAK